MNTPETEELARKIQVYLVAHKHAADSIEGIARWWISGTQSHHSLGDVELALKELVRKRVVQEKINVDGTVIYERTERSPVVQRGTPQGED